MTKKLIPLFISLTLINISVFAQSTKENLSAYNSDASTYTHSKESLQKFSHVAYMLSTDDLNKLPLQADNGDGEACWKLAKYFYCTGQVEKYIEYIQKGCEFNDADCLYEIIENYKNLIPCSNDKKEKFTNQLKSLGKKGDKKAQGYCYILEDYEE